VSVKQGNQGGQPSPPATDIPVPVLMYHSVSDAPANSTRALSVSPGMFAAQLRYLRSQGFTGLTFGELCERRRSGQPLPARAIVLTFDDGYADFIEEALPIMIEHGFPATLFVTTGWLRDAASHAAGRPLDRMLSWDQLAELSSAGVEIAAVAESACDPFGVPRLTIRRSTSLAAFARVANQQRVRLHYAPAHALTTGYAVVRRTRSGLRTLRNDVSSSATMVGGFR